VEGFARQIMVAGDVFENDPTGGEAIPNWARVLAAYQDFPQQIRRAAALDATDFAG
jgi:glucosyl-3-phosphoglycerate synthase